MNLSYILVFLLTICLGYGEDLVGRVSESIELECPHSAECGEIHSIKWYRDADRVYVYSPYSQFSNPESFLVGRSNVVEVEGSSKLQITDILPTDDGNYRCEITYLEVSESCQSVFMHDLITTAVPSSIVLKLADDVLEEVFRDELTDKSTVAGPFQFETDIDLSCELNEVKPEADIIWTIDGEVVDESDSSADEVEGGMFNLVSNLAFTLQREHLGKQVACSVEFEGEKISTLSVELDILVAPNQLELVLADTAQELESGVEGGLECRVDGGRPAPQLEWRGLEQLQLVSQDLQAVKEEDHTFSVVSSIRFFPDKHTNKLEISCVCEHPALPETLTQTQILNVLYPPEVDLIYENSTIVEGEELQIGCTFDANPLDEVQIVWYHDDLEISEDSDNHDIDLTNAKESTLTIQAANRNSSGVYKCTVSNQIGSTDSINQQIDVHFGPSSVDITIPELVDGTEGTVECTVIGSVPVVNPVWQGFDNLETTETLTQDTDETGDSRVTSLLTFIPTKEQHETEISCMVEHPAAQDPFVEQAILDVQYAPVVTIEQDNVTILEGDDAELVCSYEANPLNGTTVTWFFNSEEIEESENITMMISEEKGTQIILLMSVERSQAGQYYCETTNTRGLGQSEVAHVNIIFPPEVEIVMNADATVTIEDEEYGLLIENSEDEIELECVLKDANPFSMDEVFWFKDGEQLECSECENGTFQISASRTSSGNYTCSAGNLAGTGQVSQQALVIIYYTSSAGQIMEDGEVPYKFGNTTFLCELQDFGYPEIESYVWKKNDEIIDGEEDSMLILDDLTTTSEGNFSCSGVNEAGDNFGDLFYLDIQVLPEFILTLDESVRITEDFEWVNLTCQVECYPLCSVEWVVNMQQILGEETERLDSVEVDAHAFKDYEMLEEAKDGDADHISEESLEQHQENDDGLGLFIGLESIEDAFDGIILSIESEEMPPETDFNQFESVKSTLSINLGNITTDILMKYQFANFSCLVQPDSDSLFTQVEDQVEVENQMYATTMLIIEHGPLEIELTMDDVTVEENDTMDTVECFAEATPTLQVIWEKDGELVSESNTLDFSEPLTRFDSGEYTCVASNQYGDLSMSFILDVLHIPTCSVSLLEEGDYQVLSCEADGNPQDFTFWWEYEEHTFEGQVEDDNSKIRLQNVDDSSLGDYMCYVNNTLGTSKPCYLPDREDDMLIYIIIGIVAAVVILILVLAILYKCCKNSSEGEKPGQKEVNNGDPKPDSSFYDKLPFHGLKTPPKKVLNTMDEGLIYADVDASETYSYGPLSYKTTSLQRAKKKKEEVAAAGVADSKV